MSLKMKMGATKALPDGNHTGTITKVEQRNNGGYDYVDLHIAVEKHTDVPLRYGVPARLTPKSDLGKLVRLFTGEEYEEGAELDLEKIFGARKVKFVTSTDDNGFGRVNKGTFKPVE